MKKLVNGKATEVDGGGDLTRELYEALMKVMFWIDDFEPVFVEEAEWLKDLVKVHAVLARANLEKDATR